MPRVIEAKLHGALEELNGLAWGEATGGTGRNSERLAYAIGAWRARINVRISKGAGHAQRGPELWKSRGQRARLPSNSRRGRRRKGGTRGSTRGTWRARK
jgi:hypothetical protein